MTETHLFILETPRLILRRQVMHDLDALWALYCDPQVVKYIPDAPRTREEARQELEWHMHGHPKNPRLGLWATLDRSTGRFIGRCGLLPWTINGREEVEVAYALERASWGQGLATQAALAIRDHAMRELGLRRLICLIDPQNTASQKVAHKVGMRLEQQVELDNLPTLIYSIEAPNERRY